jgi:hypothetical protein
MARNVLLVAFGVVVGVIGGAALSIHAFDEGNTADATVSDTAEAAVEEPTPPPDPEPSYGVFDRLAACESTGNWHANTGNSYFGGLQQDLTFWHRYGGLAFASRPDLATRAAQILVAQRGLAVQGWAAWPSCSKRLGLR